MGFLISPDMQSVGLLVRVDDQWKFDPDAIRQVLEDITRVVHSNLIEGSDARIVGPAILREALSKYSFQTAFVFGILCSLICMAVTVYVFRSVRLTAVGLLILGSLRVVGPGPDVPLENPREPYDKHGVRPDTSPHPGNGHSHRDEVPSILSVGEGQAWGCAADGSLFGSTALDLFIHYGGRFRRLHG